MQETNESSMEKSANSPSGLRRIAFSFVAFAVVAASLILMFTVERPKVPHDAIQSIKSELAHIAPPPSAEQIGQPSFKSKSGAALAEARYRSNDSSESILVHYRSALRSNGWTKHSKLEAVWGSANGEKFCKNSMMATVEFVGSPTDQSRTFAFGISWNSVSATECGGSR
jgi:hypothetical protein